MNFQEVLVKVEYSSVFCPAYITLSPCHKKKLKREGKKLFDEYVMFVPIEERKLDKLEKITYLNNEYVTYISTLNKKEIN
jgi:hypothetical protein